MVVELSNSNTELWSNKYKYNTDMQSNKSNTDTMFDLKQIKRTATLQNKKNCTTLKQTEGGGTCPKPNKSEAAKERKT